MPPLTEEHQLFRDSIRRFLAKEVLPFVDSWEDAKHFPSEIFQRLGNAGFLGILIDEAWGGVGKSYDFAAIWCEEFGRVPAVGFTTGINMHSLIVAPALQRYGSEEAKQRWLEATVAGTAIGAYAFTEPDAGSDLTAIRTKAVADGDQYVLNGSKIFITNGARADYVMVLAKTDPELGYHGYTTFVVDTKLPGFSVDRCLSKLGWHSSDTAELSFTDLRVPRSMVLGEVGKGWVQAMTSLEWERLMLTLAAIGGAKQCLDDTIRYVNDRKVFGRSVGSFDRNRELLAQLSARLSTAEHFADHCVELLLANIRCRKEVSLAKKQICQLAIDLADACLQLHGGYGYTTEFKPERWLRDLRLNTIGGGTSEIMSRIAAKELFAGKEFE